MDEEELKARTKTFSLAVIRMVEKLPSKKAAWIIRDQLVRAATSIGAKLPKSSLNPTSPHKPKS